MLRQRRTPLLSELLQYLRSWSLRAPWKETDPHLGRNQSVDVVMKSCRHPLSQQKALGGTHHLCLEAGCVLLEGFPNPVVPLGFRHRTRQQQAYENGAPLLDVWRRSTRIHLRG